MGERSAGTVAVWVVAAVLATLAAIRLLSSGAEGAPPPVRVSGGAQTGAGAAGSRGSAGSAAADGAARIYVHVAGEVRRPGLVRVPEGARAAEAVARAGGFRRRANVAAVNLAARLQDGQQLLVPRAGPGGPAASAAGTDLPPSLATATAEELDGIDGIGPTLAERIVEYRDSNGGIRSIDELGEVDGIGEKRLGALRQGLRP